MCQDPKELRTTCGGESCGRLCEDDLKQKEQQMETICWVNSMFEKNQETGVTDKERGEKIRKRPGLGVRWRAT